MSITTLKVKGLPAGWRVLQLARGQNNPSDAFVLCERDPPEDAEMNFVTWRANLEMGGCFLGHYFDNLRSAESDFNKRKVSLR